MVLFPGMWQIAYASCPASAAGRRVWAGRAAQRRNGHRPARPRRAHLRQGPHLPLDVRTLAHPRPGFPVATVDTASGPVRALMLNGAEHIVTPNTCPLTDHRIGQFRARAFENMLAVAMANYPRVGGRSCAFDGIAVAPDGGPRDHCVAQAGRRGGRRRTGCPPR